MFDFGGWEGTRKWRGTAEEPSGLADSDGHTTVQCARRLHWPLLFILSLPVRLIVIVSIQTRLLPSTATLPTATPVGDSAPEYASAAAAAASGVICCCLRSTAPPGWSRRLLRSLREAVPRLPKSRACVGQHEVTPGQHHQRWIRIILTYSLSGLGLRLTDTSSITADNTVILNSPDLAFCVPSHSLCPRARCMQAEIIGPGLT